MKSEIDQVFTEMGVSGYLVLGNGSHNPAMVYLTGGGHISNAVLVQKTGAAPLLVVNAMEREEGARTGLAVKTFNDFKFFELLKAAGGDMPEAESQFVAAVLREAGLVKGKVVLYGQVEIAEKWEMLQKLSKLLPDIELIGERSASALGKIRLIKDGQELERIRQMGVVTTRTVDRVAKYIQSCQVKDEQIFTPEGVPVTIGDIKRKIDLWLAEQGAENPEGTIFAMGRDGGIPHSTGTDSEVLRTGSPIVFDIYPCEKGGGYFYDFTRTWCIGYAPEPVQKLYDDVLEVYNRLVSDLTVDTNCKQYQQWTCDLFEGMGHPTIQTNPSTTEGYNHSIGHGVGMEVHEAPWFSVNAPGEQLLKPGEVFTIEPGLYYPDRSMGVRIEDTYYVADDHTICRFVEYPYDLVLPMKGS